MKYRPEIDGLRAISVLSVFIFHLGAKPLRGGFIGVDVFFVISGYLITNLIYGEWKENQFSLTSFYVRRIKRIAPALLSMIFCSLAAGYFILSPGDYDVLARSSLSAIAGVSNFFFLQNTGYFDPAAETMPLLHTWSLAVEEQFYIIWPSLLLIFWKMAKWTRTSALESILILIAASLAAYLLTIFTSSKIAFYMPHTRAWEFVVGGAIPFIPAVTSERFRYAIKLLPWLGIALIGGAALQFREVEISVLGAVIGAYLILYAARPQSLIYDILSWRPLVFIGKISYSLYLYHFPIIVFWRHYAGTWTVPIAYFPVFIICAVVMSWLSWKYVEQPCRRAKWTWKVVFPIFFAGGLATGFLCLAVLISQGAATRIPTVIQAMRSRDVMWDWPCPRYRTIGLSSWCTGGAVWESAAAHAVIWGDSNAAHFMPLLDVAGQQQNVSISFAGSCPPIVATGYAMLAGLTASMRQCDELHNLAIDAVKSKEISMVILAAAWAGMTPALYKTAGDQLSEENGLLVFRQALDKLLLQLSAEGRIVAIISQIPRWPTDPIPCVIAVQTHLLRSASFRQGCRDNVNRLDKAYFKQFQRRTDDMFRSFNGKFGVVIWFPVDDLCTEQSCATTLDGEFIYRDEGHLRRNLKEKTNNDLTDLLHFGQLMGLAKNGVARY